MSDCLGVVYRRITTSVLMQDGEIMLLPEDFGIRLICPDCREPLVRVESHYLCQDPECRRAYAIIDHIPKLLIDESEVLPANDWQARLSTLPTSSK
ncbi:MAG: Trm112 family protein [Planctomycetaceae bacterium]